MLNAFIARDHLTAEDFVSSIKQYAERSQAIQHPLLQAISRGEFVDLAGALTRFLKEYYFYSHRFTQYLTAVMSRLERPNHRAMLMPNVMEEGGHVTAETEADLRRAGIDPATVAAPHPELLQRFLTAIGLSREEILQRPPHLATAAWVNTFDSICRHSSQEQACGALGLGTEGIVRHVYLQILQGIKRAWPNLSMADRAFFELHALVDDEHAHVMRLITIDLCSTPEGRRGVALGVLQALNARKTFFDHMLSYLNALDRGEEQAA
jgi:pyrroloquinoline quinone (PQQ) biosynthesis protein C